MKGFNLEFVVKAVDDFNELDRTIRKLMEFLPTALRRDKTKLNKDILTFQGSFVTKMTELTILKAKLGIVGKTWYKTE